MSTTIEIPGQLVPHARAGAIYLLGRAADELGKQTDLANPALAQPLQRFDSVRALLDALTVEPGSPAHVEQTHRPILHDALWEDTTATVGLIESARRQGAASHYGRELPELMALTITLASDELVA